MPPRFTQTTTTTGTTTGTTTAPTYTYAVDTVNTANPVLINPWVDTVITEKIEYQVGDIIRIKPRDEIGEPYFGWDDDMDQFAGTVLRIAKITIADGGKRYWFEDCPEGMKDYFWGDDMFELVESFEMDLDITDNDRNEWENMINQI